jgi:NAD(P)-dependent dehydrogenase (short-subunit alcohol dehydrogenase family)
MKTALVTGANRGIGFAVATGLAAGGLRVVLGCRSLKEGAAAAAALQGKGSEARALPLDVADPASIDAAVAALARDRIDVDVLVNNAGIYATGDSFSVPMAAVRESMEVHFFGPLALCRTLVPGMLERGYGRVVNVSSGYGAFSRGLGPDTAYAISKAALNALTLKLGGEVRGDVKVNAGCPGWVRTRVGGEAATSSVEEGADTIVWLATLPASGPNGGFFRHRRLVPW